jgi:DNA polymerase-3 subunit alpha
MQAIVDERVARGPYRDIFDLCERVDPRQLTKAFLEILIKAGALDPLGPSRPQHLLVVDRAMQAAAAHHRDKARGQRSLFGDLDAATTSADAPDASGVSLPPADDWTHNQKLACEKEVLGFYLTSHPLAQYADQLAAFATHTTRELRDVVDGTEVIIGGMISALKKATTKKPSRNGHSRYVNFDLEDATGVVRCILWPDDFAHHGEKVTADAIRVLEARVDRRGREPNLIASRVHLLEEAERKFTRQVAVKFRRGLHTEDDMRRVRDVFARHPGATPVVVLVETWEDESTGPREPAVTGSDRTGPNQHGRTEPAGNGRPESQALAEEEHSAHAAGNGNRPKGDPPPRSGRLRAVLTTPTMVSANGELRADLERLLGTDGFRFVMQFARSSNEA